MNSKLRLLATSLFIGLLSCSSAQADTSTVTNPTANIESNPPLLSSGPCTGSPGAFACSNPCVTPKLTWPGYTNAPACTNYTLRAINNARAVDGHTKPMVLPSNWYALTVPEQLFVIADLERVDRGYPPYLGLNANLSAQAQLAATQNRDPVVAAGFAKAPASATGTGFGGAWGQGDNPLMSDYYWMYSDGWGGTTGTTSNMDCTSAQSPGCWGHRDELLGWNPAFDLSVGLGCVTCEMGTGFATVDGQSSYVDLVETPADAPPGMYFTWQAEQPWFSRGADPTAVPGPAPGTTVAVAKGVTGSASLVRRGLSLRSLTVRWSTSGQYTLRAVVDTWRSSGCRGPLHQFFAEYPASVNTRSGTMTSRSTFYSPASPISARLTLYNSSGSAVGPCTLLGRS